MMAYKQPHYFFGSGAVTGVNVSAGDQAVLNIFGLFPTVNSTGTWLEDAPDGTLFLPGAGLYFVSGEFFIVTGAGGNAGSLAVYANNSPAEQLTSPFDLAVSSSVKVHGAEYVDDGESLGFVFINQGADIMIVTPRSLAIVKLV